MGAGETEDVADWGVCVPVGSGSGCKMAVTGKGGWGRGTTKMEKWQYNRSGNRSCDDMRSQCVIFGTTSDSRPADYIPGCWSGRWDFLSHPPWRDPSGRRQY